ARHAVRRDRAFFLAPHQWRQVARRAAHRARDDRRAGERTGAAPPEEAGMTAPLRQIFSASWPVHTGLIANRGEIALRILKTVEGLGLKAAVVYHAVDADAPAVRAARQTVEITGPTPVAAYLDGARIIAAAKQVGAGAIHPGYGFLSE